MTAVIVLELGQVSDAYARRALEQIQLHWPDLAPAAAGVPPGGSAGEVLTKRSDGTYDTEWTDPSTAFAFFSA